MALDLSNLPDGERDTGLDLSGLPDNTGDDLKGYYRQAPKPSDEYVKINKLSKSTGLPQTTVENNIPAAENKAKEPDWNAVSPKLQGILKNDINLFKVAKDDIPNLNIIDESMSALKKAKSALESGFYETSAGMYGVLRSASEVAVEPVADAMAALGIIPKGVGKKITDLTAEEQRKIGGYAQYIMPKTEGDVESGIYSGIKSISQSLLSMPIAMLPGGQQAALGMMVAPVGGQAYGAARDKGIDIPTSLGYGASQAAVEYATEKLPMEALIGGIKEGTSLFKALVKNMALEIPGEQIATVLQDMNDWAITNPEQPFSEYIKQRPSAAAQTLIATIVGTGGQVTVVKGVEAAARAYQKKKVQADDSINKSAHLAAAIDAVSKTKLSKSDKESLASVLNQLSDDQADDIYIPIEDAKKFFQDNPEAADDISKKLPEVTKSVQEASVTGGDVIIPVKDYLTYFSDFHDELKDNIRIGADRMSLNDVEQFRKADTEQFKQEAEKILKTRENEDSADKVYQSIKDQVMQTGKFTEDAADKYAAIHKAFAISMADRLGITPEEVYQKYQLGVRVPPPVSEPSPPPGEGAVAGGTQFEQPQRVAQPIPLEDEVKQLRERVKQLEIELRTSRVTGLKNKVAFDEDEGLGLSSVGAGDMDGLKRLNDTIGHKTADSVLKTLGDIVLAAEADTEGAKAYHISGDEFAFRFDSNETGQAFLDNLQKRLENVDVELDVETPEGIKSYVYQGIGLSFGVGENYEIADQNAGKQKIERLKTGLREEARVSGPPRRLREIPGGENLVGEISQPQAESALGVKVEELTDEEYQNALQLFNKLSTSRASLQTEGSDGQTIANTQPEKAWASKTQIINESGKPAIVYRGAARALNETDFNTKSLGYNTGFNASGLGVWFTSSSQEAEGYGDKVEAFHLDIRNPKVFSIGSEDDIPDFDSINAAIDYRKFLQEQGHDGIVIDLRDIGEGFHAVAFDSTQAIRPESTFYQGTELISKQSNLLFQKKRGSISIPYDISKDKSIINIFEDADLSTFIHESGHFFFEVMTDIANQKDSPQQINDDMQTVLDWYGVKDLSEWNKMDTEQRRSHHEMFARGFEAYLFEGKAPSIELKSVFSRIRAWMISIYKSIRGLKVNLTPEVRQVMDRLLATDDQIKVAESANNG